MPLSSYWNNLVVLLAQCGTSSMRGDCCLVRLTLRDQDKIGLALGCRMSIKSAKEGHFKTMRYCLAWFYLVLVLLNSVAGLFDDDLCLESSDDDDGDDNVVDPVEVYYMGYCGDQNLLKPTNQGVDQLDNINESIEKTPIPWETAQWIIHKLKSIGLVFGKKDAIVSLTSYIYRYQDGSVVNDSILTYKSKYMINHLGSKITFVLPRYASMAQARADMNILKEVAVIRADRFDYLWVTFKYDKANPSYARANMSILSRVINLIDAKNLIFLVGAQSKNHVMDFKSVADAGYKEAIDVNRHASYKFECHLLIPRANDVMMRFFEKDAVYQRPIVRITLDYNQVPCLDLLNILPLEDGYSLTFMDLFPGDMMGPVEVLNIDFSPLQSSLVKCGEIKIMRMLDKDIKVTGLGNMTSDCLTRSLMLRWSDILPIKYEQGQTQTDTIIGLEISPTYDQNLFSIANISIPATPWLFAAKLISPIATKLPCRPLNAYQGIYTKEVFAKLGIVTDEVDVCYSTGRKDFIATFELFYKINAISPTFMMMIQRMGIVCQGERLSTPNWKCHETVDIKLTDRDLTDLFNMYREQAGDAFCQNIHYSTIIFRAPNVVDIKCVWECIEFLNRFQNITADQLRFSLIRSKINFLNDFEMKTLYFQKTCNWCLNVKSLVLDNVDLNIIYKILGEYTFVRLVEIQVLNMRFHNLAIAQILTSPIGPQITSLVLNDCPCLDEVKYCEQPDVISGFSLFKYISLAKEQNQTTQDLGLSKLVLQLTETDAKLYNNAQQVFDSYEIQFQTAPIDSAPQTYEQIVAKYL
ncbi:hypothetical protein NEHOM01_2224 [Nematocida homosporus]|uniref:uncharacterized protein n=1 Tax=Nematocida homosporus TaxID=1912981 RepID=UPI002220129E|nr:uncharacterized protein NEHOM01_2224 [Nematocida homosporus]KAI5187497.1 hypothetical protein NEHOM01_2224 [Nematocida homosporus]